MRSSLSVLKLNERCSEHIHMQIKCTSKFNKNVNSKLSLFSPSIHHFASSKTLLYSLRNLRVKWPQTGKSDNFNNSNDKYELCVKEYFCHSKLRFIHCFEVKYLSISFQFLFYLTNISGWFKYRSLLKSKFYCEFERE